jgi:hypothetical protein
MKRNDIHLPTGLAFLDKLIEDEQKPHHAKFCSIASFQRFLKSRGIRSPMRPNALDRARRRELRAIHPQELVAERRRLVLPAGAAATILGLAVASGCAPATIFECLILVGLEQVAHDLRLHGVIRSVNLPPKPEGSSVPIGL